jgi:WD40 repeat protein
LKFYQGPPYKFTKSSAKNHSNFINGIKYSPLGTYFVSVSSDKKIILYDGQSFDQLKEKSNCHERSILGVDWIDEKRFVTVSADKTIKIWSSDLEELNVIHTCDETYFKDGKSFEHFQVAVKVYNGKIYSLSLNGEISEYLIPSEQDKIIYFNSEKINRHAGWLEKPVYVSNVSAGSD